MPCVPNLLANICLVMVHLPGLFQIGEPVTRQREPHDVVTRRQGRHRPGLAGDMMSEGVNTKAVR